MKDSSPESKDLKEEVKNIDMAKSCPICRAPMNHAGQIRPRVSRGRARLIQVYRCPNCGYRCLGD